LINNHDEFIKFLKKRTREKTILFPVIFLDDKFIGSYSQLVKYFKQINELDKCF